MGTIIDWVQAHNGDLALLVTSVIGTASVIVKLTPSQSDDKVVGKIVNFIAKFIALNKK